MLALRGAEVVRLRSAGGECQSIYTVDGILKLVGASSDDASTVLILLRSESGGGHPRIGELTVSTGKVALLPCDQASNEDLQTVEGLAGWSRTYVGRRIYVQKQTKKALSGTVEWHDVFLQIDTAPAVDLRL